MQTFSPDRYLRVYWTGQTTAGANAAVDLTVGSPIMTKVGTTPYFTDDNGDTVPYCVLGETSSNEDCAARKFIVAKADGLADVNSIPSAAAPTVRKGGYVWVFNPYHPENMIVDAWVTSNSVAVGDSLRISDGALSLTEMTNDASALQGSRVAIALEANSSGTNLRKVLLV